ncbi:hypothetical protein LOCC1_G002285 [Lachnellula occidentalis]|uniref:ATP synthase subunit epsilon, mitochondrial n=1 Tax=Lachnellula occidentalis TaxID=215460 RepID=A0A8H8S3E8_9HELO|nr:hypothetical protein LOCC1_G002285 [Lachnellula occidentalis]
MAFAWKASGLTYVLPHPYLTCPQLMASPRTDKTCKLNSYNKYLSVAARVVRRSLKDDKRLAAERRGEMDLKMATWKNGKQGEAQNVKDANAASMAAAAGAPAS